MNHIDTPADQAAAAVRAFLDARDTHDHSDLIDWHERRVPGHITPPDELRATHLRTLLAEREQLAEEVNLQDLALHGDHDHLDRLYHLLADLVPLDDDGTDACRFDHHGGCQAHAYLELDGERCPVAEARELLAARQAQIEQP